MQNQTDSTWQKLEGQWEQVKGSLRQRWGKLTDDDIAECRGSREMLVGKIMQRQGVSRVEAERQVGDWQTTALS
jgi:uncharacterized protein YjbJ (UPF0337 family)